MVNVLALLDARRQWLDLKSSVHSSNIAKSDIKGSFRKDVLPFKSFLTDYMHDKQDKTLLHPTKLTKNQVMETKIHAKRDEEMLHIHRTSSEHEATISMISNFYKMMRSALNSNNGT